MNTPVTESIQNEWVYVQDELSVIYCLGRSLGLNQHDAVAAYYQTQPEQATKRALEGDEYFRRFVYQGLPEERERLETIERNEIVERLLAYTSAEAVGIFLDTSSCTSADSKYKKLDTWFGFESDLAQPFQAALQIACTALEKAGVTTDDLALYGAASFGLVGVAPKPVDDVDIVFQASNFEEFKGVMNELQSAFLWSDIDPYQRLPEKRQHLKAKRWATSQIRLPDPYPLSIDLKVARDPGSPSLWDAVPCHERSCPYEGQLQVIDDSEGFCTSPALLCENRSGDKVTVLLEGYQYIGCAVVGDIITVRGDVYDNSSLVRLSQHATHGVISDFSTVPVS